MHSPQTRLHGSQDHTDIDPDSDTYTYDPGTDTTGTDVVIDNCGNRAFDGVEESFPAIMDATTVWFDDHVSRDPHIRPAGDAHPGWATRERYRLVLNIKDKSEARFSHTIGGVKLTTQAKAEDAPETVNTARDGVLTQDGNTFTFTAKDGFPLRCQRSLLPTHPDQPGWEFQLLCTDSNDVRYRFYSKQAPTYTLHPKCLAEHDPLPFPTRWSRIQTDFLDGSTFKDWEQTASDDGRLVVSRFADLWLKAEPNTGGMVRLQTTLDRETKELSFTDEQRIALTRTPLTDTSWRFDLDDGELMTCEQDVLEPERVGPGRPFAMTCIHDDGRVSRWVPTDLSYPFGWGSHDLPGGWWSR